MKNFKLNKALYFSFFKIALFTFGGGIAMLSFLEQEIVEKKKWATHDQLLEYYALAQCTPGVIATNTATFVGYHQNKIWGGIFATLGIITPSILIVGCLFLFFSFFQESWWIPHALKGIQLAVCVLIIRSVFNLSHKAIHSIWQLVIVGIVVFAMLYLKISATILILITIFIAVISYVVRLWKF